jgi:protein Mpv17
MTSIVLRNFSLTWRRYCNFLDNYGWKAQAINTSILMGAGDIIAQLLIEKHTTWEKYDKLRTLRFFGVGLCILGPSMHVWYTGLDKIIKTGKCPTIAVKKMLMDQALFLPPYIATFIIAMSKLRLESNKEMISKLKRDFKPILLTSYQVWPGIQIANFYYVPLQHRILVMNVVGLFWNTYIAWKAEIKREQNVASTVTVEIHHSDVSYHPGSPECWRFWNKYAHIMHDHGH